MNCAGSVLPNGECKCGGVSLSETYQARLNANRYAQTALALPQKYGLNGKLLRKCAQHLAEFDSKRIADGKTTHQDLLTQEATRWAKAQKNAVTGLIFG